MLVTDVAYALACLASVPFGVARKAVKEAASFVPGVSYNPSLDVVTSEDGHVSFELLWEEAKSRVLSGRRPR